VPTPHSPQHRTPYLTAATHLTPDDGACLMEAVSAAAGLPWTDRPSCTHPLLAHLARLVNDAMSDQGRQQLVDLVPTLAVATPEDPARTAEASARMAVACTEDALRIRPTPLLAHLHHVASTRLRAEGTSAARRRVQLSAVRRRIFLHGPGARAVEQSVRACVALPPEERDAALGRLLRLGLAAVNGERFSPAGGQEQQPGSIRSRPPSDRPSSSGWESASTT
jgi:hypothetical protein